MAPDRISWKTWTWVALSFCVILSTGLAAGWALQRYELNRGFETEAERIATMLGIREGSIFADVGAGSGKWSIYLAGRVGPKGRVFTTEESPELVATIENVARKAGLTNMTVVQDSEVDTNLPPSCCEAMLVRNTYHDFTQHDAISKSIFRTLRPGGQLLVIDFHQGTSEQLSGHGYAMPKTIQEFTDAGFETTKIVDDWARDAYAVLFTRPLTSETAP